MNSTRVTLVSGLGALRLVSPREPEEYAPPLGVLTLAAILRPDTTVHVVDLDDLWRRSSYNRAEFESLAIELICASKPNILGFSSLSGSYPLTLRLAQACSDRLNECTIVLGGPQATVTDVATITAFPFVDMILRGEADDSFPALIAAIVSGSSVAATPGLTFRDRSQVVRNPNGSPTLNLERLPLPAYDLISRISSMNSLPLEIGRGCPFSCKFCATNDFFRRNFRLKSAPHALEEMKRLHMEWGITTFQLVHDMFTVDRRKVIAFCETMIEAGAPYKWACSARTDSVDLELLRLMRQAGCHDIFFGIESGSRRMQRIIDKDLDLNVARAVLRDSNSLEIHCDASLIVGFPQETKEDLRDTINFFADAMLWPYVDPQLNVLTPLAATPITEEYRNRLTLDDDWVHVSENGTLQDVVDRVLIASYPEIFCNFYSFPFYTNRNILPQLRDFLYCGNARCAGLMRALYRHSGDMFSVFERWHETCPNPPHGWFESVDFVYHLLSFCEVHYSSSSLVMSTSQFYKRVFDRSACQRHDTVRNEPYIALDENVYLIDCESDINAILEALSRGEEPNPDVFLQPVTVAIRFTTLNRAEIARFPTISLDLMRHAEKSSTVAEIIRDFENRNVCLLDIQSWKIALGGLEHLAALKLIKGITPDQIVQD